MATQLKPNDEMRRRALLALLDSPGMPDADLVAVMTLSGDLKRADRVLSDAIETGEIVRDADGSCQLGARGLALAGLEKMIELEKENDERDDY